MADLAFVLFNKELNKYFGCHFQHFFFRSGRSSRTRSGKKKKLNEKVSEYQLLALSCKLLQKCINVCKYASIHV